MMLLAPDGIRLCSLYLHVLLGALAIGLVLRTDWALFQGDLSYLELASISHKIVLLLAGMWVTGLTIIYIDTAFQWAKIS